MLFLADNFQEIGYGKKMTEAQWDYLVNWTGERCSKYDKKEETYQYRYHQYQGQQHQGQQYQEQQYQEQQYLSQPFYQYQY